MVKCINLTALKCYKVQMIKFLLTWQWKIRKMFWLKGNKLNSILFLGPTRLYRHVAALKPQPTMHRHKLEIKFKPIYLLIYFTVKNHCVERTQRVRDRESVIFTHTLVSDTYWQGHSRSSITLKHIHQQLSGVVIKQTNKQNTETHWVQ